MTEPKRFKFPGPPSCRRLSARAAKRGGRFVDDPDRRRVAAHRRYLVDARTHYHKRLTEIYYILEGEGEMELDGERHAVRPGDAILIKPGCRHRAIGQLRC